MENYVITRPVRDASSYQLFASFMSQLHQSGIPSCIMAKSKRKHYSFSVSRYQRELGVRWDDGC